MDVLIDGEIVLYGVVGDGFFFTDEFSDRDVAHALAQLGHETDVTVRINSGGGIAMIGVAICNALKAHGGKVTVSVDGIAASAASVIAMGGDEIVMRNGSMMMIHDPAFLTFGTADDHKKGVEVLDKFGEQLASIYATRTGKSREDMRAVMRDETWLTAEEAVEGDFADSADDGAAAEDPTAFDYRVYANAPERLVSLAQAHAWTIPARGGAAQPAVNRQQQRKPEMTDQPKNGGTNTNVPSDTNEQTQAAADTTSEATTVQASSGDERARISAIVNSEEAKGREGLAKHLAFETDTPAEAAVEMLKVSPKAATSDPGKKYENATNNGGLDLADGDTTQQRPKATINPGKIYASRRAG